MAIINERLRGLLAEQKMSYQDLANLTGIDKATLHRYCQGNIKKIPIDRVWTIAFTLGTTPQYLMGDTDSPDPNGYRSKSEIDQKQERSHAYDALYERLDKDIGFKKAVDLLMNMQAEQIYSLSIFLQMMVK